MAKRIYTKEQSESPLYHVWSSMKARCLRTTDHSYKNYGARGITICEEWLNSYVAFYEWSIANGYQQGLSIDRIDVNGDYCPENCRWANNSMQSRNKRNNIYIEHNGESKILTDWAKGMDISKSGLAKRINAGWDIEEALGKKYHKPNYYCPTKKEIEQIDRNGNVVAVFASAFHASKALGLPRTSINRACLDHRRHESGWAFRFTGDDAPIKEYKKYCKIQQFDLDGNFIREWDSVHEIEKELGYNIASIRSCCYGQSKSSYGYIWKSIDGSRSFANKKCKAVLQYTLEGEFITEFKSVAAASEATNVSGDCIRRACGGRNNNKGKGFIWKYKDAI